MSGITIAALWFTHSIAAAIGFLAYAIVSMLERAQDAAEGWHVAVAFRAVDCTDGIRRSGRLMRRRTADGWEYRPMTATEIDDAEETRAW